jgi:hypothetical protein
MKTIAVGPELFQRLDLRQMGADSRRAIVNESERSRAAARPYPSSSGL